MYSDTRWSARYNAVKLLIMAYKHNTSSAKTWSAALRLEMMPLVYKDILLFGIMPLRVWKEQII